MTKIYRNFITEERENDLVTLIDELGWDNTLSRRTQHYGYRYDYRRRVLDDADPIPDEFKLDKGEDCCIINEYKNGQGISAHTDHTRLFADRIFVLSLLDDVTMVFRKGSVRKNVILPRRSLLVLEGNYRYNWTHELKYSGERRISITYRSTQ